MIQTQRQLTLLSDNMLTIRLSRVKVKPMQGGLLPLMDVFTYKELFQKGISKGLKEKSAYFISQLMSSNGMRLLKYKDLKHRINIKLLIYREEFQLKYNLYNGDVNTTNVKTRNWIATFCKQVDMPIIGRVLNKLENDKIRIKHWK
ncbi:unnamed protein product [Rhizophagus irregularis]|nr:unnamed protein product [Rhizophagus irregularis]